MRLSNDKSPGAIASGTLTAGRFFPQQGRRFRASDKLILDQADVAGMTNAHVVAITPRRVRLPFRGTFCKLVGV